MRQLVWKELDDKARRACLVRPSLNTDAAIQQTVRDIAARVRGEGDEALKHYARLFDKVSLDSIAVDAGEIEKAGEGIDDVARAAIDRAYENIRVFHEKQGYRPFAVETMPGVSCQRIVRPLEKVGLYVPGGSAPLVSTTLMLGIPAQVAGCRQVILFTPCDQAGNVNPHILYAAKLCGIGQIFRIGGAQAIAAMAYGTQSVPRVDKIFGPGNAYVTATKTLVAQDAGGAAIDMPAGPSEVCVIADGTTPSEFAAADLLSQAEHDALSQVVLITTSAAKIQEINKAVERQLADLPRRDIARAALESSLSVLAADMEEALSIANAYAPEHLILCFEDAKKFLSQINNAGSVFLGPWTPESAGDYASGTNHVLPTYGYARAYSGLSVEAFQKTMTVQNLGRDGLRVLGPVVETLAGLEGLQAHARAVSIRLAEAGNG